MRGQVPQAIQIELAILRVPGRRKQQPSLRGLVSERAVAMPLQTEQQRTSRQRSAAARVDRALPCMRNSQGIRGDQAAELPASADDQQINIPIIIVVGVAEVDPPDNTNQALA